MVSSGLRSVKVGVVPAGSRSVIFDARGDFTLTFSGQPIPVSVLAGSAGSFLTYGGDISSFAERTGELRIQGGGTLDNIRFSDQAIPEPSVACLAAIGAGLLCWLWRRGARA